MLVNLKKKISKLPFWGIIIIGIFEIAIIMALTFWLAGRLDYWQGWAFWALTLVLVFITIILFRDKMDLAKERISPGPGMKWWDKIIWAIYLPAFLAVAVVAPLDAGRFMWSPQLPIYVYIISYAAYIFSITLSGWAMLVNKWFSSVVRIQKDREQKVVQTGPYRFVRHPGYVAGILMALSIAVALGSLWALVPAGIVVICLVVRTYLEDVTLQKELEGYKEFTKKTKYRLIPGIW